MSNAPSSGRADDAQRVRILGRCAEELRGLAQPKPWMTAQGLARKLGGSFDAELIRTTLIDHAAQEDRCIRYSYYPSRRTLDILWGHIEVVGEIGAQPDLFRDDGGADSAEVRSGEEGSSAVFLSHNHRDAEKAFSLADRLDDISCWLFQTGIRDGELIAEAVQEAIRSGAIFVTYVTGNSLGSLWVQKEFVGRQHLGNVRAFVVIDGSDKGLVDLFASFANGDGFDWNAVEAYAGKRAADLGYANPASWIGRCEGFIRAIDELLGCREDIYSFPDPKASRADRIKNTNQLADAIQGALATGIAD